MEPIKKNGNGQLNLNTFLLALGVGLSGWALKSIEELKEQLSAQIPVITSNSSSIMGINGVNKEQTEKIDVLSNRVTALETKQSDSKNKN
jgi:hypothetical protein